MTVLDDIGVGVAWSPMTWDGQGEHCIKYFMIHYFPVIYAFVYVSVDALALVRTIPDRMPLRSQSFLNMHWTVAPSSFLTEEDAPRFSIHLMKLAMHLDYSFWL